MPKSVAANELISPDVDTTRPPRALAAALASSVFLTMLPVTMLVPVLKELVSDRFETSAFWAHMFMSVNMIGAVIAAPLCGMFSDRIGHRKVIIVIGLALDAVILLAMAVAPNIELLLILRFFEGMAHIVALSTLMALAADWAPSEHRGRWMGLVGGCVMFGTTIGSALGGVFGRSSASDVLYIGSGISAVAAVLAFLTVREARRNRVGAKPRLRLAFLKNNHFWIPCFYTFVDRLCVGVLISTFMLYLGEVLNLDPGHRGRLMVMFMMPFATLCYPMGRLSDRTGRVFPLIIGSALFGAIFSLYGIVDSGMLPILMVASGVVSAIMFAPSLALCTDLAPKNQRAVALAGFNVSGSLGFLFGPLVAGLSHAWLLTVTDNATSYRLVLVLGGAFEVICVLITLPFILRLYRRGKVT